MPKENRTSTSPENDWKYQKSLIMSTLSRLEKHDQEIFNRLNRIDVRLAKLTVKSGIWGLIGACIPVIIGLAITYIKLGN